MREPTLAEKRAFSAAIVDTAIIQAAESSGLRKWLIEQSMESFTAWDHPNAAELMLQGHDELIESFSLIIDPDTDIDLTEPFSASLVEYPDALMAWLEEA